MAGQQGRVAAAGQAVYRGMDQGDAMSRFRTQTEISA